MSRQFISVAFRAGDKTLYTYHNDGEPVGPGDQVQVETKRGERTFTRNVEVVKVLTTPPTFATKPILGKVPPPVQESLL